MRITPNYFELNQAREELKEACLNGVRNSDPRAMVITGVAPQIKKSFSPDVFIQWAYLCIGVLSDEDFKFD
jgi:hypothetical protein